MAGVKGRSGGARPGAGRKPGTKNPETIRREALFTTLTKNIEDVLVHVENERQMRRHQAEIIPAIRRAIERTQAGQPALLEFLTSKEQAFSLHPVGSVAGVLNNT